MQWSKSDLERASRAALLHARKKWPGLADDVYDDLAADVRADLLAVPRDSVEKPIGLAVAIIERKAARHFRTEEKRRKLHDGLRQQEHVGQQLRAHEPVSSRRGRRQKEYGHREQAELHKAVIEECRRRFREFANHDWTEAYVRHLLGDPQRRAEEEQAGKLLRELQAYLKTTVKAGTKSPYVRSLWDSVRLLWATEFPDFIENRRTHLIAEWDRSNFFGLQRRATDGELAVVSLLCGNFPDAVTKKNKITVGDVLLAEQRAIANTRKRWGHLRGGTPMK